MDLERYEFSRSNTFLDFEFESVGPKGKLKKIIRFSLQNVNGISYFNLAFGDLNKETGEMDDLVITDNKDKNKILATVAAVVLEFTNHFPDMTVYAMGSTASRTRLYQMAISIHLMEIEKSLDVFGFVNGNWEMFSRNVNYQAFFVIRKKL